MNKFFPVTPAEFTSLSAEFAKQNEDFVSTFFKTAEGSQKLAIRLTEAQAAYYKMIKIGSAAYPNDAACMNAILNGLTAREYLLANLVLMGGGWHR